jgi:hypothetical protein
MADTGFFLVTRSAVLFHKGLAVGALIHRGIPFMGTDLDAVQAAVILATAVVGAGGHGTMDACFTSPREIFSKALLVGAVGIILAHNHPSGYSEPSMADFSLTKRIKEAGKLLNVELLDHIVVGNNCYLSLCEEGILEDL